MTKLNVVLLLNIVLLCVAVALLYTPKEAYRALMTIRIPEPIVSKLYDDNAEIQYLLGNRHLGGEGKYDLTKAARFYDNALALDEKLPYLHYQRARIYFLTMEYRKGIDEVNKEISVNPNFSRSYYLRGLIYGYDRRFPEAASDFTEFINREPDEWAGYNDLAWILFQLGDYEGVKTTMEQILPNTRNAWLLNAYGVALLNLEKFEEAQKALLEAKDLASRTSAEEWGNAYIGNDPIIYRLGIEEMRRNINENIKLVDNRLSKEWKQTILK